MSSKKKLDEEQEVRNSLKTINEIRIKTNAC